MRFYFPDGESRTRKVESTRKPGISEVTKCGGKVLGKLPKVGLQRSSFEESCKSQETTGILEGPSKCDMCNQGPTSKSQPIACKKTLWREVCAHMSYSPEDFSGEESCRVGSVRKHGETDTCSRLHTQEKPHAGINCGKPCLGL